MVKREFKNFVKIFLTFHVFALDGSRVLSCIIEDSLHFDLPILPDAVFTDPLPQKIRPQWAFQHFTGGFLFL